MNKQSIEMALPRAGIKGVWDKFVGPGASLKENLVALIPASLFACFVIIAAFTLDIQWHIGHYLLACFLAFDVIGGIATTATRSAKRWYHKSGITRLDHMKFIITHVLHIGLFAWAFTNNAFLFFVFYASLMIIGSVIILLSSASIRQSVANLLVFVAVLSLYGEFGIEPIMYWFVPALFIKLFASYLPSPESQQGLSQQGAGQQETSR